MNASPNQRGSSPGNEHGRFLTWLLARPRIQGAVGRDPQGLWAAASEPFPRGLVVFLSRLLSRAFFRRIEVEGIEHVPAEGGGIVVSWHPNGLIDPVLIHACVPRAVIFGARDGLFRWPILGWLMRLAGTVPIARAQDRGNQDSEQRWRSNQQSIERLADAVGQGGLACLFPEGTSHDSPFLTRIKSGAARLYFEARQRQPERPIFILPVGLHYDAKHRFRSHVLIRIHAPLELPATLEGCPPQGESTEESVARCQALTSLIDASLQEVVQVTVDWETHHRMSRVSRLLRAERARRAGARLKVPGMLERQVAFWRVWELLARWREIDPERVRLLMERVGEYDADLRALGLRDEELDRPPERGRVRNMLLLSLQMLAVYLIMPSLIAMGGVVNIGPTLFLRFGSRVVASQRKDLATLLLLGGAVLFPMTWLAAGLLGAFISIRLHAMSPLIPSSPILAGLTVVLMAVLGGMVALRYLRLVRETARAVRVRLTRLQSRRAIARLIEERRQIALAFEALEEGHDLPGSVSPEGAVMSTELVMPGGRA